MVKTMGRNIYLRARAKSSVSTNPNQTNIMKRFLKFPSVLLITTGILGMACQGEKSKTSEAVVDSVAQDTVAQKSLPKPISEPLVTHIYTADPSAHVFNGKIYIYPSHDIESNIP